MTTNSDEVLQDVPSQDILANLAFMKAMVSEGPRVQAASGLLFLVAGLAYGLDCLAYVAQIAFKLELPEAGWLFLAIAPTAVFVVAMVYVIWRERKAGNHGVATRAINAAYGSAGLANLFVSVAFGYVATTQKSMVIWLLYPIAMCAVQGSVWYVAYMIRRKLWLVGVSAGWFLTTLVLAYLIRDVGAYLLVLGIALIGLMGGAGAYLLVQAKKGA